MKLIYMEITHNTDDSARDLSSLGEGEELKKKKKKGKKEWDSDFSPPPWAGHCCWTLSASLLLKHILSGFRSCVFGFVCVMESVCVNSCPCADPAALQPASLVPADPSCCLIAQRKAITLKQHDTLAASCRCLSCVSCSCLTGHGCRCHVYGCAGQIAQRWSRGGGLRNTPRVWRNTWRRGVICLLTKVC